MVMSILHLDIAWRCAAMSEGRDKAPGGVERHNFIIVRDNRIWRGISTSPESTYES